MNNNIHVGTASGPTLPGLGKELMGVSDFNGDGKPDLLLFWYYPFYRPFIWYMNNNVYVGWRWGRTIPSGWSLAGATDFNRDGRADYLLYNSLNQTAISYNGQRLVRTPRISSGWYLFAP